MSERISNSKSRCLIQIDRFILRLLLHKSGLSTWTHVYTFGRKIKEALLFPLNSGYQATNTFTLPPSYYGDDTVRLRIRLSY